MKCIVQNCTDRHLKDSIKQAIELYASNLMHKNFLKKLTVTVRFDNTMDPLHYAALYPTDHTYPPKKFVMQLKYNINHSFLMYVIAHEVVHIRQYAKGQLNYDHSKWKKAKVKKNLPYVDQPWEKEAFRLETKLYEQYKKVFGYA